MSEYPELQISEADFNRLLNYSHSLPTDPRIGFRWRCQTREGNWFIGEAVDHPDPTQIGIKWHKAVVVIDPAERAIRQRKQRRARRNGTTASR